MIVTDLNIDLTKSPLDEGWFLQPITVKVDLVDKNYNRRSMTDATTSEVIEYKNVRYTMTLGVLSLQLWPNERGTEESFYHISISNSGGPIASFYCQVPDVESVVVGEEDITWPLVIKPWFHHFVFPWQVVVSAGHWTYESGNVVTYESGNTVNAEG
jgi:hypothetical protein